MDEKWCMKWNEFDTNIREYLRIIREDQKLIDVFLKSNQTNMLIYLKGINSVQLGHLLDFIYNGEASVGQEELKDFLETGKELQVKGFEAYVAGVLGNVQEDPVRHRDEKEDMYENRGNIIEENF